MLSIVEALTVTGPVKPLLMFARMTPKGSDPAVRHALMTTRRGGGSPAGPDLLRDAAQDAGVEFLPIAERRAFDPGVIPQMRAHIFRIGPDVVETHDCKSHFLFLLLRASNRRIRALKWVTFNHGYTRTSWKIRVYQLLDRITLPRADRVVTLCKPFAAQLASHGVPADKIRVLTNAVAPRPPPPPPEIEQARARLAIRSDEVVILTVGRLSREKGHDDLIAAFRTIRTERHCASARLVIVGDGPERPRLEQLAAPLGTSVLFPGHVADPWPLFHAADLFALPSHSEGSPLVVLEAMAAGKPIVATAVGGVPELLVDGATGVLVPPGDAAGLAAALTSLLQDAGRRARLAIAASGSVAREHSAERYAAALLEIYRGVLGPALPRE